MLLSQTTLNSKVTIDEGNDHSAQKILLAQLTRKQRGSAKHKKISKQANSQMNFLTEKLCRKQCCLSIVFIVIILAVWSSIYCYVYYLHGVQLNVEKQDLSIFISEAIGRQYKESLNYMHYSLALASSVIKSTKQGILASGSLQSFITEVESPQNYRQIHREKVYRSRGGVQCIKGSQSNIDCSLFSPISGILWQYIQNQALKQIIQQIVICENISRENRDSQSYSCIGTPVQGQTFSFQLQNLLKQVSFGEKVQILKIDPNKKQAILAYAHATDSQQSALIGLMKLSFDINKVREFFSIDKFVNERTYLQVTFEIKQSSDSKITIENTVNKEQIDPQILTSENAKMNSTSYNILSGSKSHIELTVKRFQIEQTQIQIYFISILFGLLYFFYIGCVEVRTIKKYSLNIHQRKQCLNKMYKLAIKDIFMGKKPVPSAVMKEGALGGFFYELSQLINRMMTPIVSQKPDQVCKKRFKFKNKTKNLIEKYKTIITDLMHFKNKHILNNRFNIQSYINSICEKDAKRLKQYFMKALQLDIVLEFFKFGYMALLRSPQKYEEFLQEDTSPMPKQLINQFVRINTELHQIKLMRETIEKQILNFQNNQLEILQDQSCEDIDKDSSQKSERRNIKRMSSLESDQIASQIQILKKPKEIKRYQPEQMRDRKAHENKKHKDKIESDQSVGEVIMFSENEKGESRYNISLNKGQSNRSKFNERPHDSSKISQSNEWSESQYRDLDSEGRKEENWGLQETREQLEIRIRVHMIPKYLIIFKDLDLENQYAKKLGVQKQVENLSQIIDNTRYLLTRHNKNIRIFSKSMQ